MFETVGSKVKKDVFEIGKSKVNSYVCIDRIRGVETDESKVNDVRNWKE
jgi:hypothetical protein